MNRGRRRSRGRDINGVLVLDKPQTLSSNDALQRVKHMFRAEKAGHTGSLDPLATGVLPLCFGEATKLSQYLLNSDKRYWTTVQLGVRTDSGDADGKVINVRPVVDVTAERVNAALQRFIGEIDQIPSMFSAVKHEGQPLYKLARQGIEVERKARRITIFECRMVAFRDTEFDLEIHCSKGTYVRCIAEELGEDLGCGGHVTALRRLQAGPFCVEESLTMERLEAVLAADGLPGLDALLQPVWSGVRDWPEVRLEESTAYYLRQGQSVMVPHAPTHGWVRLCAQGSQSSSAQGSGAQGSGEGEFLGVGEVLDDGRIAPRRLLAA